MYDESLPIRAEIGYFIKVANGPVKPVVNQTQPSGQIKAQNTPTTPVKGFRGKFLSGVGKVGGALSMIGLVKMLFGKSDEDKYMEQQVRWARYKQLANDRYNKAMYPEYFT